MPSIPLTKENILNNTIDKIDTWPYLPSGLLIKPAHKKDYTDQLVKLQHSHFAEMQRLVERYRDKQKISISWILAAGVGISGNLIVNLFFGHPKISNIPYENLFIIFVFISNFRNGHGGRCQGLLGPNLYLLKCNQSLHLNSPNYG